MTCRGHDSSRKKLQGLGPLRGHRPYVIRELWREWQVTQSTVGWPGTCTVDHPGITNWWKSPWQDPYLSPKDMFLQLILQDFWQVLLRLEEKIYNSQLFTLSTYINSLWRWNKGNLNVHHISHSCGFWKMVCVFKVFIIYLFLAVQWLVGDRSLWWVEKKKCLHNLAWPTIPDLTSHSSDRYTLTLSTHSSRVLLCPQILPSGFAHLPPTRPALHMSSRPRLHIICKDFHPNSSLPFSEFPWLLTGYEATANHFTFLGIKIFGKGVFEEVEVLPLLVIHHSVLGCSTLF